LILTYRNEAEQNDKTNAKRHKLQSNDDDFLPLLESAMESKSKLVTNDGPNKTSEKRVYLGELMKDKEGIKITSGQSAYYRGEIQRMRRPAESEVQRTI
jgi:hypothetical protein